MEMRKGGRGGRGKKEGRRIGIVGDYAKVSACGRQVPHGGKRQACLQN